MTEEIATLASEYLSVREQACSSEANLDELREERDDWKSKMENLDEEDPLFEIAQENYEDYSEEVKQIEESENSLKRKREELLRAIAERFIPRGDWTEKEVLQALNDVLLGKERDHIKIDTICIEPGDEVENDEQLFEIATAVRSIGEEELGKSDRLEKFWNEFQELKRFRWFKEIATADGSLSGKDIAERVGEEDHRQTISQNLIDTTKGDINPYFKEGRGEYSLSLVGEYLLKEHGDFDRPDTGSDDGDDGDDDGDSDATLDKFE